MSAARLLNSCLRSVLWKSIKSTQLVPGGQWITSSLNFSSVSEVSHSTRILASVYTVSHNQVRNHWRQRRSKHVPYTKPLNFDFSGDLDMSVGEVDLSSPKVSHEDVPELSAAEEKVKNIFSLQYSPYGDVMDKRISEMLKKVQDHPLDIQSLEIKIARLTIQIRRNIEHCLRFRHDKVTKLRLTSMINVRKSMLRELRMNDIEKFDWLTRELKLRLVERPEGFKWPSKAEKRKEAATQAAIALARAKTEKLKAVLEEQKVAFKAYKELELSEIEQGMQELGLGVEHMTSLETALSALDHSHLIPCATPVISREEQLRQLELARRMPVKKEEDNKILHLHGFCTPEELKYYPDIEPETITSGDSEKKQ